MARPSRLQFFQPGELPLVLLELVREQPRHGYELMNELDRLFGPTYRASAGSVYPALTALVEERLLLEEHDGPRKRYRSSAAGTAALAKRKRTLAAIELRTGVRFRPTDEITAIVDRFAARVDALRGHIEADDLAVLLDAVAVQLEHQAKGERDRDR